MSNVFSTIDRRQLRLANLLGTAAGIRWLRTLLIVAATLVLAYNFGRRPSWNYILLPPVLAMLWIVIKNPWLGILGMIGSAFVVPFAIGTGTGTSLNIVFLMVPILMTLWLLDMVRERSIKLAPATANWPLLGLIVAISISFLIGYLPWNVFAQLAPVRAQVGEWALFVFSAGAFWLAANRIRDIRHLRWIVWLFLALGSVYILSRLAGSAGYRFRAYFVYGSDGSLFWVWFTVLAAGQALFNRALGLPMRIGLAAIVAATFVVAFAGDARAWSSGWLPPVFSLCLLFYLRWPRGSILLALGGALLGLVYLPVLQFLLFTSNQYSILTRGAALAIIFEIVKVNPLLGIGPANYFYYTPLYPILGYYVRFNSHNQYIDIIAQTGIIGLTFFTWFAVAMARLGWSLRKKVSDGFSQGYVNAAVAGLAGTLMAGVLGDWILPFVYNIGLAGFRASVFGWLFLGGLVAIAHMLTQAKAEHA